MKPALTPTQIGAIVDFSRDLVPLAGLGKRLPAPVVAMAATATWLSLGCTPDEAVELAPGLIAAGVIKYRCDPGGGNPRIVVPCGRGWAAIGFEELIAMAERHEAKGGAR